MTRLLYCLTSTINLFLLAAYLCLADNAYLCRAGQPKGNKAVFLLAVKRFYKRVKCLATTGRCKQMQPLKRRAKEICIEEE